MKLVENKWIPMSKNWNYLLKTEEFAAKCVRKHLSSSNSTVVNLMAYLYLPATVTDNIGLPDTPVFSYRESIMLLGIKPSLTGS